MASSLAPLPSYSLAVQRNDLQKGVEFERHVGELRLGDGSEKSTEGIFGAEREKEKDKGNDFLIGMNYDYDSVKNSATFNGMPLSLPKRPIGTYQTQHHYKYPKYKYIKPKKRKGGKNSKGDSSDEEEEITNYFSGFEDDGLVSIRVEIDIEGQRVRECFLWQVCYCESFRKKKEKEKEYFNGYGYNFESDPYENRVRPQQNKKKRKRIDAIQSESESEVGTRNVSENESETGNEKKKIKILNNEESGDDENQRSGSESETSSESESESDPENECICGGSNMTAEEFAIILVDDLCLPKACIGPITNQINSQIKSHKALMDMIRAMKGDTNRKLNDEVELEEEDESIMLINLDLVVGGIRLTDKLEIGREQRTEWLRRELKRKKMNSKNGSIDISDQQQLGYVTPEMLGIQIASDLGLSSHFANEIALAIREQFLIQTKNALTQPHTSSLYRINPRYVLRDEEEARTWGPSVTVLSEQELEKYYEDQERFLRRRRRENRELIDVPVIRNTGRPSKYTEPDIDFDADKKRKTPRNVYLFSQQNDAATKAGKDDWRCVHCGTKASDTPGLRKGPQGLNSLCNACGLYWTTKGKLPEHRLNLYRKEK